MKRLALAGATAWFSAGLLVAPVLAQDGGGIIIWAGGYAVGSGDQVDGDLIVVSGPVEVEEGGTVRGDLIAVQGDVRVAGGVEGDIVAALGRVELNNTASVGGDVVSGAGRVHRSGGARVQGQILEGRGLPLRFGRVFSPPPFVFGPFTLSLPFSPGGGLAQLVSVVLSWMALVALALVAIAFWPAQLRAVGATALSSPWPSLGLGLVVGLASIPLFGLLTILVCTIPLAALLLVGLVGVFVYGWTALGLLVGERVLEVAQKGALSPLWAGGVGVTLLSLITGAPCFGFLFALVAGAWGVGATLLSRFGTQPYPLSSAAPPTPSAPVRRSRR